MRAKLLAVTVLGMAAVIFAPVMVCALAIAGWAQWRGWSPTRPRYVVAASWTLPLIAWAAGLTPLDMWLRAVDLVQARDWAAAWVPLLPLLVPLGITVGACLWAARWNGARHGLFKNPLSASNWPHRQWARAMHRAGREARKPGLVPMASRVRSIRKKNDEVQVRGGDPVLGRVATLTYSEAAAPRLPVPVDRRLLEIPLDNLDKHLAVVGESGAGKTVLLMRLMRSWLEATWLRHWLDAGDRPLLVFLDCKGGTDGPSTARAFAQMASSLALAPGRIGLWPKYARLDLWQLPQDRLIEVLCELYKVDHPHYEAIRDEVVALAVGVPGYGPPISSKDFTDRLDAEWLLRQYGPTHAQERQIIKAHLQEFATVAMRFRATFRRLGRTLDSGRPLDDFDALCLTLDGSLNEATAAAQALAALELLKDRAGSDRYGTKRRILLVVDEFSAISQRVKMHDLLERGRSLKISVIPAAQGWTSLGPDNDARERMLEDVPGGLLLMATTSPGRLVEYGGYRDGPDVGMRSDSAGEWGDRTSREHRLPNVNPEWVRTMGKGQVVYMADGRALWGSVTPADVTEGAPSVLPEWSLRKAVEARRFTVLTKGERIPVLELESQLTETDIDAVVTDDEFPLQDTGGVGR